jgi:PAS domain S-box-containing protein
MACKMKNNENNNGLILVVEDSPTQAERLKYILEENNFKVLIAKNGKEALSLIKENKPSMVISDIVMPEMSGFELCKLIKADKNLKDIPVILLTSLTEVKDVYDSLSCGADSFINKPYNEIFLISHVKKIEKEKNLNKNHSAEISLNVSVDGKIKTFFIDPDKMLNLLISTYEAAVCKNKDLIQSQYQLKSFNDHLEELVEERTKELSEEVAIRKQSEVQVKRLNRVYTVLSNINQVIVRVHDSQQLLKEACLIAVDEGKFQRSCIWTINNEVNKIETFATAGLTNEYFNHFASGLENENPIITMISSGKHYISNNILTDNRLSKIWKQNSLSLGISSFGAFPLIVFGKVAGGFDLYSEDVDFFDDTEICLLDEMATDISFALEYIQNEIQHKLAEESLRESEEKYRILSELSPEMIFLVDLNGYITYLNKAGAAQFKVNPREIEGKHITDIFDPDDASHNLEHIQKVIKTKSSLYNETEMKFPFGKIWLGTRLSPIFNKEYQVVSILGLSIDITERKRAEKELIKAKEKAESANKLKDAFIANISHEIRTPLTGIIGMTSIIKELFQSNIKKEDEVLFEGIDISSNRIIRTVDMILNFSRLQVGDFNITPNKINISLICTNLVKEFNAAAKNKSLELSFQNNCGDTEVLADEYSITMAISNLIDNAIKFTNKGSVTVILHKEKNDDLVLDVKDTGIGINQEYIEHIFEPYRQEEMGYGRAYEGVGLGLAIVKKVIDLNNAIITVVNKKGEGTTFSINFGKGVQHIETKSKPVKAANILPAKEELRNKTVLLVEDDQMNQITIRRLIENSYRVVIADSSNEAMDILKKEKVDIILMDITIKGNKNGLELTKELRASKEFSHIPIIAVTAHAFESDKINSLAAGCDSYLVKPFTKESLLEMVAGFARFTEKQK